MCTEQTNTENCFITGQGVLHFICQLSQYRKTQQLCFLEDRVGVGLG